MPNEVEVLLLPEYTDNLAFVLISGNGNVDFLGDIPIGEDCSIALVCFKAISSYLLLCTLQIIFREHSHCSCERTC